MAIMAFSAYLTTHPDVIGVGATEDATQIIEKLKEYIALQGWNEEFTTEQVHYYLDRLSENIRKNRP